MPHEPAQTINPVALLDALSVLFPEMCGAPVDLEEQAPSIVQRVLNDGAPDLVEQVVAYFGEPRVSSLAQLRVNQLTNPAFRTYGARFHLPPRDPRVTSFQALWRK